MAANDLLEPELCDVLGPGVPAGHAAVQARDAIDAAASGAAQVVYAGAPRVTRDESGAGSIRAARCAPTAVARSP